MPEEHPNQLAQLELQPSSWSRQSTLSASPSVDFDDPPFQSFEYNPETWLWGKLHASKVDNNSPDALNLLSSCQLLLRKVAFYFMTLALEFEMLRCICAELTEAFICRQSTVISLNQEKNVEGSLKGKGGGTCQRVLWLVFACF
jgi:hypothetical protein